MRTYASPLYWSQHLLSYTMREKISFSAPDLDCWALVLFSFPRTQTDLSSSDQGLFFGLDDSVLAVMSAIDAVEGGENPIPTHTHATMNLLKWKKIESVTSSYRSECGKKRTEENRKNNKRRRLHKNINSQKQLRNRINQPSDNRPPILSSQNLQAHERSRIPARFLDPRCQQVVSCQYYVAHREKHVDVLSAPFGSIFDVVNVGGRVRRRVLELVAAAAVASRNEGRTRRGWRKLIEPQYEEDAEHGKG